MPVPPDVRIDPPVRTPPWWEHGEAACRGARLRGAPPPTGSAVWCETRGQRHGPYTSFHANGRVASSGRFHHGEKTGRWTTWFASGRMATHGQYRSLAECLHGPPGADRSTCEPSGRTGAWRVWRPSGATRSLGVYRAGRPVGMWLEWTDPAAGEDEPADRWIAYDDDDPGSIEARGAIIDGVPRRSRPICALGLPYPECRVFPIAGFNVVFRDQEEEGPTAEGVVSGELGAMVNVDDRHGVGLSAGPVAGAVDAGVRAHYRFWLFRWLSLDASLGAFFGHELARPAPVAQVAITLADTLGIGVEAQRIDLGQGAETTTGVSLRIGWIVIAAFFAR